MRSAEKRTIEDARNYFRALTANITPSECKNYFEKDGGVTIQT
jgi:hypothetical protein